MASKQPAFTQALLARAHSPDSVNRIFSDKIQHRPFLLRPSSPPPANARDARRRAREKKRQDRKKALRPKPLSARQRRKLALYDVPREGQRYALFEPLHRLWLGYVREILGQGLYAGGPAAATTLCGADFHGAEIEVVRSTCVSRVGLRGIVIKDAKFVFELITKKNRLKFVPKEGTVFRVEIPGGAEGPEEGAADDKHGRDTSTRSAASRTVFEIHGDQFRTRSADRATKKFKPHFLEAI